jgi:hypothetical protein
VDLARAEAVEKELDAMIRRRDDKRRETEGERRECWQDGDGHRYDGSRFGAGRRTPGIVWEGS